jgi:hypothetical protein
MANFEMNKDSIIQIDQDETDTQYNSENENDDNIDSPLDQDNLNNNAQLLGFLLRNNKHASTFVVLIILFTTMISLITDLYKKFYKDETKLDDIMYAFHSTKYSLFNNETASNSTPLLF